MTIVKIKRVYEEPDAADGLRVLIDYLWPRGMKKENLHYDIWGKDLAPSSALRKWFHEDMDNRWPDFKQKYLQELKNSEAVDNFIMKIKFYEVITLLYASKNVERNHAIILREYIKNSLLK